MATPVKRIEKEFLLKVLYDEQIPVMHIKGKTQYVLIVEKHTKGQIFFKADRPVEGMKARKKIDLMFDYRGQVIIFSAEVSGFNDEHIVAIEPEFLYKNLDRSFSRVQNPIDLQVQFTFSGDRYSLSYPKVAEYEATDQADLIKSLDPKNLSGLVDQLAMWIKGYASGYKLMIFKDAKPSSTEERLIAETGKAIFLTSTSGQLPAEDPLPKKNTCHRGYLQKVPGKYRCRSEIC